MSKGKTKNQTRVGGRFAMKAEPRQEPTTEEYIQQVRNELFAGYNDTERIKKAYQLITGNDYGNNALMRRTIISYNNN